MKIQTYNILSLSWIEPDIAKIGDIGWPDLGQRKCQPWRHPSIVSLVTWPSPSRGLLVQLQVVKYIIFCHRIAYTISAELLHLTRFCTNWLLFSTPYFYPVGHVLVTKNDFHTQFYTKMAQQADGEPLVSSLWTRSLIVTFSKALPTNILLTASATI